MANLKLDPVTHDLDLTGDALSIVDGDDAIVQDLKVRLQFFKGEWKLDTRIGFPYFQDVLIKNPNLAVIRSLYREAILETPGILAIEFFDLSVDAATRKMSLSFSAEKTDGGTLDFSEEFLIGD
jgi:hypothetical protein